MNIFSRRYRVYTEAIIINAAIAIGFLVGAGVIWTSPDWGYTNDISRLAIGLLAVGLAAAAAAVISAILMARSARALTPVVAKPEEPTLIEKIKEQIEPTEADWKPLTVVEDAVDSWAASQKKRMAGFTYEVNKMDKWNYFVNLFNDKNVRVVQFVIVANKDRTGFEVTKTYARQDAALPEVEANHLKEVVAKAPLLKEALNH